MKCHVVLLLLTAVSCGAKHCFRLLLTGYWAALLCVCVPLIWRVAEDARAPKIAVRKLYHLLAAAIFAPGVVVDAPLLAVAAAVAFAALVALEVIRIGRIPPLGEMGSQPPCCLGCKFRVWPSPFLPSLPSPPPLPSPPLPSPPLPYMRPSALTAAASQEAESTGS